MITLGNAGFIPCGKSLAVICGVEEEYGEEYERKIKVLRPDNGG